MNDAPTVTNNVAAHRFEIQTDGDPAVLTYRQQNDVLDLVHTEVAPQFAGHGYASALARAALEYARANNLKVIPTCPFVRAYMVRHPEYDDLRATR